MSKIVLKGKKDNEERQDRKEVDIPDWDVLVGIGIPVWLVSEGVWEE